MQLQEDSVDRFVVQTLRFDRLGVSMLNSSNHHDHDPFMMTKDRKTLLVDKNWWDSQGESLRVSVQKSNPVLCTDFEYPHVDTSDHPVCAQIYAMYCDQFTYEKFSHLVGLVCVLPLTEHDVATLTQKTRAGVITGRPLTESDLEDFGEKLRNRIDEFIRRHQETGIFIRTNHKSAKNDTKLRPLFSVRDALEQLTHSRDILRVLETRREDQAIVMLPWEPRISTKNEFRVFVNDRQVRAISQQRWFSPVGLKTSDAVDAARGIVRFYDENFGEIEWPDVVLDVWCDLDPEGGCRCHLIEINPGGRWASSGSSLFHWIRDDSILTNNGDTNVYVRILSDEK